MSIVAPLKLSKPVSNEHKLNKLCEWIDINIDKPIGWGDLTEQSGMDHMALQREFVTHLQTSPMQWIRNRRNELIQTAMAYTQLSQPTPAELPASLLKKTRSIAQP